MVSYGLKIIQISNHVKPSYTQKSQITSNHDDIGFFKIQIIEENQINNDLKIKPLKKKKISQIMTCGLKENGLKIFY